MKKKLHAGARALVGAGLAASLTLLSAGGALGQDPGGERERWETRWRLSLGSEYDDNPFRLRPGQKDDLNDEGARYVGMASARDVVHTMELRGELRGRGLSGRRLTLGAELGYDVHTLNPRRSAFEVAAFASQKLSKRDELELEVAFTPSEFRRSYLVGGESFAPEYAPGEAQRLEGRLEYDRVLLRGKGGGPELGAALALVADRRTFQALPWRDRNRFGGEVQTDLEFGGVGLELSAERLRAVHDPREEPVYDETTGLLTWGIQDRDFDETTLGAETRFRYSGKRDLSFRYDRRLRDYGAADGAYAERQDTRQSFGAAVELLDTRHVELVLGGRYVDQISFRPSRGDTGDESDYTRSTVYLRMNLTR